MKKAALDLNLSLKKIRNGAFLEQIDQFASWAIVVELIAPYYPQGKNDRLLFSLETMLRIHCLQQRFTSSDPGMKEVFSDSPLLREFVRLPDESNILRLRYWLEKHKLIEQIFLATINKFLTQHDLMPNTRTVGDATLIAAPLLQRIRVKHTSSRCIRAKRASSGTSA